MQSGSISSLPLFAHQISTANPFTTETTESTEFDLGEKPSGPKKMEPLHFLRPLILFFQLRPPLCALCVLCGELFPALALVPTHRTPDSSFSPGQNSRLTLTLTSFPPPLLDCWACSHICEPRLLFLKTQGKTPDGLEVIAPRNFLQPLLAILLPALFSCVSRQRRAGVHFVVKPVPIRASASPCETAPLKKRFAGRGASAILPP